MKKTYKYDNCTVNVYIPNDDKFQDRLRKASETFMRKVMSEGNNIGNSNTRRNFREE